MSRMRGSKRALSVALQETGRQPNRIDRP